MLRVSLSAASIKALVGFKYPGCTNTNQISSCGFAGRDERCTERNGIQQELHPVHGLQLLHHIQVPLLHCTQRLLVMVRLEITQKKADFKTKRCSDGMSG